MIRHLGSLALRLWVITLVTAPVCLYLMPLIIKFFPGGSPPIAGGCVCVILGSLIWVSFDLIGQKRITGMIKKGETWERAGIFSRAKISYENAVSLYASSLLSPLFGKEIGDRLTGTLARFSLTAGIDSPSLKLATAVYLKSSPGDETLASLWLEKLKKEGVASPIDHEVLTALANIYFTHKKLMVPLADVLLGLGRMDYAAKRVYKSLLDDPELEPEIKFVFHTKINGVVGEPGEELETFGKNISDHVVATSSHTIESHSMGSRYSMGSRGIDWLQTVLNAIFAVFATVRGGVKRMGRAGVSGVRFCIHFCLRLLSRAIALIREKERVRFYLRAGGMGILCVWLLFFMGSTISHIFTSRALEKEPRMIEGKIASPFTIQVAAYLKQAHADRYAKILTKKGISPFITKVMGGGKPGMW